VARARQTERRLINDYQLLAESQVRGETTEERVAQTQTEPSVTLPPAKSGQSTLHPLPRLRQPQRPSVVAPAPLWLDELPPSLTPPVSLPVGRVDVNEFDEEGERKTKG
jgi:hypothetical protein